MPARPYKPDPRAERWKKAMCDWRPIAEDLQLAALGHFGDQPAYYQCTNQISAGKYCTGNATIRWMTQTKILLSICNSCGERIDLWKLAQRRHGMNATQTAEWGEKMLLAQSQIAAALKTVPFDESCREWGILDRSRLPVQWLAHQPWLRILDPDAEYPDWAADRNGMDPWVSNGRTILIAAVDARTGRSSGVVALSHKDGSEEWGHAGRFGIVLAGADAAKAKIAYVFLGSSYALQFGHHPVATVIVLPPVSAGHKDRSPVVSDKGNPPSMAEVEAGDRIRALLEGGIIPPQIEFSVVCEIGPDGSRIGEATCKAVADVFTAAGRRCNLVGRSGPESAMKTALATAVMPHRIPAEPWRDPDEMEDWGAREEEGAKGSDPDLADEDDQGPDPDLANEDDQGPVRAPVSHLGYDPDDPLFAEVEATSKAAAARAAPAPKPAPPPKPAVQDPAPVAVKPIPKADSRPTPRKDPEVPPAAAVSVVSLVPDPPRSQGPDAAAFLRELLAGGIRIPAQEVVRRAQKRGISRGAVHAAKAAIGVETAHDESYSWYLPASPRVSLRSV